MPVGAIGLSRIGREYGKLPDAIPDLRAPLRRAVWRTVTAARQSRSTRIFG
jgi:hypothetical protein